METKKSKIALEDAITRSIMADNGCTAHFEYENSYRNGPPPKDFDNSKVKYKRQVTVMTYNPKSEVTFLLKQIVADTDEEGLEEILKYTNGHKEEFNSFTVVWKKKGEGKEEKSYFYCKDLFEALEKFYYNKNREDYIVFSTQMNPIA